MTLTVDVPFNNILLLKNGEQIKPSDHIKLIQTTPNSTDIQIIKVKPDDEGKYSISVDGREQPLVQLKVIPKPVVRQIMNLERTEFNEGDTLTIECRFDTKPEEDFEFLRNDEPLINDERISTSTDDNTFKIIVKNLKPKDDEGVYTLKSPHLILDTPEIIVIPRSKSPTTEDSTESIDTKEENISDEKEQTPVVSRDNTSSA